jgi:hypothetical protein
MVNFAGKAGEDVAATATQFKNTALAMDPSLETLLTETSQTQCQTLLDTASELNNMQYIYVLVFESGLE